MTVQLDLFLPNDEESLNLRKIEELEDYLTRSNRAQFAKMNDLMKKIIEQEARLDRLIEKVIK